MTALPTSSLMPTAGRLAQLASLLPSPLPAHLVAGVAGQVLRDALDDGDLDLLCEQVLAVCVLDSGLELRFTQRRGRLRGLPASGPADVTIAATAEDLLLLLLRRSDPDSLFFQRRLRLSGNTELGLAVKNLLDTVTVDRLPRLLTAFLRALPVGDSDGR
ncbi:SCP2 sterol-binding domain-containing protein [Methylonatrum kenyense]|uniref:ubiquinone anaerobic biosynthesis accessory factor UbiT n=1 Tax=Methylonatrum kenyense TaxID=455253 RepID=UPI0020BF4E34|nr:SCP2 sterol-binding domain-containing protein [Methylonatrum kenyense]MCK8515823.1 SCP2 sterol-binding domain-containing protein [Methylonatrum kenyense]